MRTPSGHSTIRVDQDAYAVAEVGSRVDLQVWHGDVAAITVNSAADKVKIPAEEGLPFAILLAWAGLGLLVGLWRVRAGMPRSDIVEKNGVAACVWILCGLLARSSSLST
ncbi:MAG: hypothetical protein ACRDS0_13235 [Pseudonocardiaceae bacterium]